MEEKEIQYVVKCWWGKVLENLVNRSYVAKIKTIMFMIFRIRFDKKTTPHQHGEYLSLTPAQKFLIGKCTAEDGVTAIIPKPFLTIYQIHQFFDQLSSNSFGVSPIYYCQSFIMQAFANILPYQYFATYSKYDIFYTSLGRDAQINTGTKLLNNE